MSNEAIEIGGTMCNRVIFVSSDSSPLVGIQLYNQGKPEAFFAMDVVRARAALDEFEKTIERAERVKTN